MIKYADGHYTSEVTLEELEESFQKDYKNFSPAEREVFELMLQELSTGDSDIFDNSIYKTLHDVEWIQTPIDMETFVRDPYYLGNTCDTIFPKLLEDLKELFSGDYNECVLTGSLGFGKTFMMSIGICRILYELSCMRSPQKSYGLANDSGIAIVCLSVNELLATKVTFENIATKIKASPYFQENFPFKPTKKELRFPRNIWVAARATTDTSALGLNAIGSAMDESNFYPTRSTTIKGNQREIPDPAEVIYNGLKRRMKTRFERHGKLPGMLFVASSKIDNDDFTMKRIAEAKTNPHIFVRDYPLWGTKENHYSDTCFYVLAGNETVESKILDSGEEDQYKNSPEDNTVLVKVPEDFRSDFESDLEGALRDLAGIATGAIHPFIQRRAKIIEAVDKARKHPFTENVWTVSKPGQFIWQEMVRVRSERQPGGYEEQISRPIISPLALRHVHIDPSLRRDATGFVMAHVGGFKQVIRRAQDGRKFTELAPIIVVDFMLRIQPPKGGEIILAELRQLVYDLSAHGYSIQMVTQDSYQSADSIQALRSKGYKAEVLSVDLSPDPYDALKMMLYEDRLKLYEYAPVLQELRDVEEQMKGARRIIDHPAKKSKDVADALAACCFVLQKSCLNQPLPMMQGDPIATSDPWITLQPVAAKPASSSNGVSMNFPLPFLTG